MSESKVPTPQHIWFGSRKLYTIEQMRSYGDARAAEARRLALLEAAEEMEGLMHGRFIADLLRDLADEAQPNRSAMAEEKQAQNP